MVVKFIFDFIFSRNEVNNISICFKVAPIIRQQPAAANTGQQYMYSSVPHSLGPNRQQWSEYCCVFFINLRVQNIVLVVYPRWSFLDLAIIAQSYVHVRPPLVRSPHINTQNFPVKALW